MRDSIVAQADDAAAFMPAAMVRQLTGSTRISLDGVSLVRIGRYGKTSIWRVQERGR